ncbi:MAG: glycerol-3-phosphate 1-O-acyltransferase PlsY [Thiobacillaceae bacterium]|jgi:glycerol-3-phosphate acyltransferase PlsY
MESLPFTLPYFAGAYLIGSLSFAVIVSKLMGLPDPRSFGSGNPGATNMLRTGKKTAAVLTLLGDFSKGYVAVKLAEYIGAHYGLNPAAIYAACLGVFIGHLFPLYFGFNGGKGVATALGILFALHPMLGLGCLATWLVVFALSRISSLSALAAAAAAPVYAYVLLNDYGAVGILSVLVGLLFWRHRGNIRRLLSGEEGGFAKPTGISKKE